MHPFITVEEAQASLKDLVERLGPGEELIITQDDRPVAKLVGQRAPSPKPRPGPGLAKGTILYMAPDFDEPLEESEDIMSVRDAGLDRKSMSQEDWLLFVRQMAGSIPDPTFVRHVQGEPEDRDGLP